MNLLNNLLLKWNIKSIIFDLDGTLIDTLDLHIQAFQILFKEINKSLSYEKIADNMGRTPRDTLLTLIPELRNNKNQLDFLAKRKEEILTNLINKITKFPGANNLLEYVRKLKLTICLASSTPKYNVIKMLQGASIEDYFQVIITGEDISIGKPNPEIFLKAAEKSGIQPKNCLVIGDSPHDIIAAKKAGMKVIAVTTGKHSIPELKKENPDWLIFTLKELMVSN
ncbi:MAG: HAD family phosphatase [Candidatus Heimdallarchaeota archaeon]|nr:HAD family phosphatase [Candidatus Heimdallarchaeota archaeon]